MDIHEKLMQSYKHVPEWWFLIILIVSIALSLLMSFIWRETVQLPWWGMLFAFVLSFIVTLPVGVIQATTNQVSSSNFRLEIVVLPGTILTSICDSFSCSNLDLTSLRSS